MDAIPAEFAEEAELRRQELLEAAADCDDDLMEKVLMEEEVTVEELKAAIRKGTIACKIHPVFVGSSYKNKGVQELLDAVVDYMPSPVDIPAIKGTNPDDRRRRRASFRREGPVQRARVQDHDRPVRGQAHLPARLLGPAGFRLATC